jgi:hypothetical protein
MRKLFTFLLAMAMLTAACGGGDGETATTAVPPAGDVATDVTEAPAATDAPATTEAPATAPDSDPADSLLAALDNAAAMTSGRTEATISIVGAEGMPTGGEMKFGFSGEFDAAGNSSFIIDLSQAAAASGEEIPDEFADLLGEMEVRTIGDTAYLRFGLFSMFGVQTTWVSMAADEAGMTAGSFGASPINPADVMSVFGRAVSDFEDLGRETIREVETTHLRTIINVEEMIDEATAEELAELGELGADLPVALLPVDFWIDDAGNIHQFQTAIDGTLDPEAGFVQMTMTWNMFDHGAPIAIVAPPADDVTDGSELETMFTGFTG